MTDFQLITALLSLMTLIWPSRHLFCRLPLLLQDPAPASRNRSRNTHEEASFSFYVCVTYLELLKKACIVFVQYFVTSQFVWLFKLLCTTPPPTKRKYIYSIWWYLWYYYAFKDFPVAGLWSLQTLHKTHLLLSTCRVTPKPHLSHSKPPKCVTS